jgi:hypothetical protein
VLSAALGLALVWVAAPVALPHAGRHELRRAIQRSEILAA